MWVYLLEEFLNKLTAKTERIINWMSSSGLKVNDTKTEICIFHRTQSTIKIMTINNTRITTSNTINILGITFDCNLKWNHMHLWCSNYLDTVHQNQNSSNSISKPTSTRDCNITPSWKYKTILWEITFYWIECAASIIPLLIQWQMEVTFHIN